MPRKRYSGVLAEPLPPHRKPTIADGDADAFRARQLAERTRHIEQRLTALYRHYGVDPQADEAMVNLAMGLAFDHVPGFQTARDNRPPLLKWDEWRLCALFYAVYDLATRHPDWSKAAALKHIAANKKYRKLTGGIGYERLKEIFRKACDSNRNPWISLIMRDPKRARFFLDRTLSA